MDGEQEPKKDKQKVPDSHYDIEMQAPSAVSAPPPADTPEGTQVGAFFRFFWQSSPGDYGWTADEVADLRAKRAAVMKDVQTFCTAIVAGVALYYLAEATPGTTGGTFDGNVGKAVATGGSVLGVVSLMPLIDDIRNFRRAYWKHWETLKNAGGEAKKREEQAAATAAKVIAEIEKRDRLVQQLNAEADELRKQLKAKKAALTQVKGQLGDAEKELERKVNQLATVTSERDKLQKDLDRAQRHFKTTNDKLSDQLTKTQLKVAELDKTIATLEADKGDLQRTMQEMIKTEQDKKKS
jgi:hypothetical protein